MFIKIETTDNNVNEKEEVVMEQERVFSVLRARALADGQKFVFPYVSAWQVDVRQLSELLTTFNSWLELTGEQITEERDYRRHFALWLKYRDTTKVHPVRYNVEDNKKEPESKAMPLQKVLPVPSLPLVVHAVPAATKTLPLPVILPEEQPTGKFSKRDNKYDMHWLKNLRDELRRTGV